MLLTSGSSKSKIDDYPSGSGRPGGATTAAQHFAHDLFNSPETAINYLLSDSVKSLHKSEAIYTVHKLLNHLPLKDQIALQKAVICTETGRECADLSELVAEFKKSDILKTELDKPKYGKPAKDTSKFEPPSIEVNPVNGLSLFAADPLSASVILEHRKAQNKLAEARLIKMVGIPSPTPLPFRVLLGGGGNLDPLMPIDMRGAGPMIAAMRAGSYALGTVGYPTQWRPVSDSTFISYQLEASLAQVTKGLAAKGIQIDSATVTQIENVNQTLKDAEKAVKENRDILNKYNNMLASGDVIPSSAGEATLAEMKIIVDKYNDNLKAKNKSEVKILRVLAVLAAKLY
jgi:hypothetical protein